VRPVPPSFHTHPLPWHRCSRDTPGAVFTGSRWVCPPNGPGTVIVAAAGVAVLTARAVSPWLPYWKRRPVDAPSPVEHGPRVVFRGTPAGVEVGGLS
jgi:hypothetical protein